MKELAEALPWVGFWLAVGMVGAAYLIGMAFGRNDE
jgi:hypothetical protein